MYIVFIIMMVIGAITGAIIGYENYKITKMADAIKKQSEYVTKYSDELFKGGDK